MTILSTTVTPTTAYLRDTITLTAEVSETISGSHLVMWIIDFDETTDSSTTIFELINQGRVINDEWSPFVSKTSMSSEVQIDESLLEAHTLTFILTQGGSTWISISNNPELFTIGDPINVSFKLRLYDKVRKLGNQWFYLKDEISTLLNAKVDKSNGASQITDSSAYNNLGTSSNATQSTINSAIDSAMYNHTHEEYIQNQEFYFDGDDFVIISDEQTITKTLTIQWNDSDNANGLRPRYLQATINGITTYLSEESEWSVSLPVDTEDSYTWTIPNVLGYTITSQGEVDSVTTFVATQTAPQTLIIQWEDSNNAAQARPHSLQATINGITTSLSEENEWSASVLVDTEDTYTWTIPNVLGYTIKSYNKVDNVTTVILKYRAPSGPSL